MTESPDGSLGEGAPAALSEPERRILELLQRSSLPLVEESIVTQLALSPDVIRGSLQRLKSKQLVVVSEQNELNHHLTARGEAAARDGLPERKLLDAIAQHVGGVDAAEARSIGLSDEELTAAIGLLRRARYLADGLPFRIRDEGKARTTDPLPAELALRQIRTEPNAIEPEVQQMLVRRGLVAIDQRSIRHWAVSAEGKQMPVPSVAVPQFGALTPSLLGSQQWRTGQFRPYDVRAAVPWWTGARPHPYAAWIREFEEILIGLGFEESDGPLLETEFWNSDVLFMPQDHPARSVHDVLFPEGIEGRLPAGDLLARVAAVHEGRPLPHDASPIGPGWGQAYDPSIARRPVLRSQTTAVSARYLARKPTPPVRMYCLDRNFRRESVDATHHVEFGQCEGIIAEEGITLRHLIGIFRAIAEAIGIRELKIRPSYFPFTEPSIEGYVRHPRLGWIEIFPGGMFRPEVLRPLGIGVPVAAWGIGVTRLAMVAMGVNDIRDLFLDDLGRLTGAPR